MKWLPDIVLKIAHILPSYYYIKNNELLAELENISFESLQPILINMGIILLFAIAFMIIANVFSKRRLK